jgi:hypothetical protein
MGSRSIDGALSTGRLIRPVSTHHVLAAFDLGLLKADNRAVASELRNRLVSGVDGVVMITILASYREYTPISLRSSCLWDQLRQKLITLADIVALCDEC